MCPVGGATPMVHGPCLLTTQPSLFLFVFSCSSARRVEAAQPCVRRGRTGSRRPVNLLVGGGLRQPHPFHHLPPIPAGVAPHRRRFIKPLKSPDASDGKGNGVYPPTTLDCGTTKHRHRRFGPVI
ncbi:helicase-like protein [Trypanosoma cruzi]|nr:helicase-like protein [Trypanosoma cruzi]